MRHESGRHPAKAQGDVWDSDSKGFRFREVRQMSRCHMCHQVMRRSFVQLDFADFQFEHIFGIIWVMLHLKIGHCRKSATSKDVSLCSLLVIAHLPKSLRLLRQKPLEQSEMLCILKQAKSWKPQESYGEGDAMMHKSSESTVKIVQCVF